MCLSAFVSALGSHEMGHHKLPIIVIVDDVLHRFSSEGRLNEQTHLGTSVSVTQGRGGLTCSSLYNILQMEMVLLLQPVVTICC